MSQLHPALPPACMPTTGHENPRTHSPEALRERLVHLPVGKQLGAPPVHHTLRAAVGLVRDLRAEGHGLDRGVERGAEGLLVARALGGPGATDHLDVGVGLGGHRRALSRERGRYRIRRRTASLGRLGQAERATSIGLVIGAVASVQLGAAVATTLFDDLGPSGAVLLRTGFAAVILVAIWRPALPRRASVPLRDAVLLGLTLAGMNLGFYAALDRIPLGIAVTLEFTGPLRGGGRRLAARQRRGLGGARRGGHPAPVALARLARRAGRGVRVARGRLLGRLHRPGGPSRAGVRRGPWPRTGDGRCDDRPRSARGGSEGATRWVAPICWLSDWPSRSSARRFPTRWSSRRCAAIRKGTFGVLMSLEPAVAAFVGLVVLGQGLSPTEVVAIALVVGASAGALGTAGAPDDQRDRRDLLGLGPCPSTSQPDQRRDRPIRTPNVPLPDAAQHRLERVGNAPS